MARATIQALPNGYATIIASGLAVSPGGIRIALARRVWPIPVLVIDEPAGGADLNGAAPIMNRLSGPRPHDIVDHPTAGGVAMTADHVVFLDGARVIDQVIHAELAERSADRETMIDRTAGVGDDARAFCASP